jgi:hypothetical protein
VSVRLDTGIVLKVGQTKLNKNKLRKLDIVVIRINALNELCNARPCYKCLEMLKSLNFRYVYYSVSPTEIIRERVRDMISIEASSVTKYLDTTNNALYNNKDTYYRDLLINYFPEHVTLYNLNCFITYNLQNLLPTYRVKIINTMDRLGTTVTKIETVIILDDENITVVKAIII